MIIAVDAGKGSIKVQGNKYKGKFENLVLETANNKSSDEAYQIKYNNKNYLIGNGINGMRNLTSNKIIFDNKLAIYTGIAKAMKEQGRKKGDIYLSTGLPNQQYNKKNTLELKKLLAEDVQMEMDGEKYNFKLEEKNIIIVPENYNIAYKEIPRAISIDIGYRHININVLEHGIMMQNYMLHSETGIIMLKNIVAKELENEYREHFYVDDITDEIILNGLPRQEKSKDILLKSKEKYIKSFINDIESKNIKLTTMNKFIIRGGGINLISKDIFEKEIPSFKGNILIDGGEYRNVEIYHSLAKLKFEPIIEKQRTKKSKKDDKNE